MYSNCSLAITRVNYTYRSINLVFASARALSISYSLLSRSQYLLQDPYRKIIVNVTERAALPKGTRASCPLTLYLTAQDTRHGELKQYPDEVSLSLMRFSTCQGAVEAQVVIEHLCRGSGLVRDEVPSNVIDTSYLLPPA